MEKNRSFFILLGCILLVVGGCKQHAPEQAARQQLPVAKVRVVKVSEQSASQQNEATASVEAVQRATIAAKVTGTIEKMPVGLGSQVKKGDLLVKISAGEIAAKVSQSRAQLEQARRNYEREKRLLEKNASTPETVKSMKDALLVAEAAYDEAKTLSGYTTITAPFDGLVAQKMVQTGDLAVAGKPLLVLKNNHHLQVVAAVPEVLALKIHLGDKLTVRIPAAEVQTIGVVREIAPSADSESRTTLVKVQLNGDNTLRPGQFAKVVLPGAPVKTFLVPEGAVSRFGQMERVWVVQNGTARLRLVRTGEHQAGQVEILAGLNAGDQVIVQGGKQLVDGQPVQIISQ
ncbi:MAG: efflux RND transporter periplasmic adaptor subunit [Deltaproteobacteria bacterium]